MSNPTGLWLPLITPFVDQRVDEASLRRLVRHYDGIDGLILAGTTGELATLDEDEIALMVDTAVGELREAGRATPVHLGQSGSDTCKAAKALERANRLPVNGYLIACPAFTRPSQEGLYRHFQALAQSTDRPIVVYNIPYRTGVNLANDTLLRLAELPNIVGVKDCCADPNQSFDLMRTRPQGFSVLSGEDGWYFSALSLGGDGGILASAHIATAQWAELGREIARNDTRAALTRWRVLADLPRLLFAEPNPAPIKHWLWRAGLIASPETRLPMTGISAALATRLDETMSCW